MRMFAEDDYLLESSFLCAADALLQVMRHDGRWTQPKPSGVRDDLRRMLKICKQGSMNIGKNVVIAFDLSNRWEASRLLEALNAGCLDFYDQFFALEDSIGGVANCVRDTHSMGIGYKDENEGRQRTFIDFATSSTCKTLESSLPIAVQMLLDSSHSLQSDTSCVLFITDGVAGAYTDLESIKSQLQGWNHNRIHHPIHVVVLGLEISDSKDIKKQYKELCDEIGLKSCFVDANVEMLENFIGLFVGSSWDCRS